MVFSKLAKLPTTDEMKEQFLRGGLRVARKQRDPIHILARIVDLKKLYEKMEILIPDLKCFCRRKCFD